jgi:phosphatidylserine decarboxylase
MRVKKIIFYVSLTAISIFLVRSIFLDLFDEDIDRPRERWDRESIIRQLKTGNIDRGFKKFFDRDPDRKVPEGKNIIVAPADGRVISVEKEGESFVILINLSFYDVHVQRIPISGKVMTVEQKKGKYLPNLGKEYLIENFQVITTLDTEIGKVQIRQIAGLYAKRIKTYVKAGDRVVIGQKLGRILFGSSAVLTLPADIRKIEVAEGQQIYAAETIIARY